MFYFLAHAIILFTVKDHFLLAVFGVCSERQADVLFILDSSASLFDSDFESAKRFVSDYKDSVVVGTANFQISIIRFSNNASVQFYLNTYTNSSLLEAAVNSVQYYPGGTNTAAALQLAKDVFSAQYGMRTTSETRRYVIVVTDGLSRDPVATKNAADELTGTFIDKLLSIGVNPASLLELHDISSAPDNDIPQTVFNVTTYSELQTLVQRLVDITCDGVDACSNHTCLNGSCVNAIDNYTCDCYPGFKGADCEIDIDECENINCTNNGTCVDKVNQFMCICVYGYTGDFCETDIDWCESGPCQHNSTCQDALSKYTCNCGWGFAGIQCEIVTCVHSQVDLLLLVESSISLTSDDFAMTKQFLKEFINYFVIGHNYFQISLITFSGNAVVQFYLNNFTDTASIDAEITSMEKGLGESNLTLALHGAEEIFASQNGGRSGSSIARFTVVITKDIASVDTETIQEAFILQSIVDKVIVLAIGSRNPSQLMSIASQSDDKMPTTVFIANDFNYLSSFILTMVDIVCDGEDSCGASPCHQGDCHNQVDAFFCECYFGYTGQQCETEILECDSNPCRNGATCNDELGAYSCTCGPGFTGQHCLTDIEECASNPCPGNSTCIDGVNGYNCSCFPGYTGPSCKSEIDECLSEPCVNGAECADDVAGYSCTCLPGYTGAQCELDIDECFNNPCPWGSVCSDDLNTFTCQCPLGIPSHHCKILIVVGIVAASIVTVLLVIVITLIVRSVLRLRNKENKVGPDTNDNVETNRTPTTSQGSNETEDQIFSPRVIEDYDEVETNLANARVGAKNDKMNKVGFSNSESKDDLATVPLANGNITYTSDRESRLSSSEESVFSNSPRETTKSQNVNEREEDSVLCGSKPQHKVIAVQAASTDPDEHVTILDEQATNDYETESKNYLKFDPNNAITIPTAGLEKNDVSDSRRDTDGRQMDQTKPKNDEKNEKGRGPNSHAGISPDARSSDHVGGYSKQEEKRSKTTRSHKQKRRRKNRIKVNKVDIEKRNTDGKVAFETAVEAKERKQFGSCSYDPSSVVVQ